LAFPLYGTLLIFRGQTIAYEFIDAVSSNCPLFDVADECQSSLQVRALHIRVALEKRGVEYSASPASGIPSQYISAIAMPIDQLAKTDGTHYLGGDEVGTGKYSNITISWVKFDNDRRKKRRKRWRRKNPVNYWHARFKAK